jgi:hypothetical protein
MILDTSLGETPEALTQAPAEASFLVSAESRCFHVLDFGPSNQAHGVHRRSQESCSLGVNSVHSWLTPTHHWRLTSWTDQPAALKHHEDSITWEIDREYVCKRNITAICNIRNRFWHRQRHCPCYARLCGLGSRLTPHPPDLGTGLASTVRLSSLRGKC